MNSFYQNSFFRKKKVLVIVPHMDDEINVAGSMIHSLAGMGCDITVLYTTNGDDAGKGAERIAEAEYALRVLAGFDVEIRVLNYKSQARVGRKHILFSKRNEVVKELIRFIGEHRPEIIFCCDMDAHPDHLCTSLFFEEALGRVLGKKGDYSPFVYKGFAYETAYFATNDFFSRGGGQGNTRPFLRSGSGIFTALAGTPAIQSICGRTEFVFRSGRSVLWQERTCSGM